MEYSLIRYDCMYVVAFRIKKKESLRIKRKRRIKK